MATTRLLELIQGKTVVCEAKDTDRYGRTVAICRASGEDLSAIMVREGMAWAFVRYSRDYVDQEARARADRLGVHAHDCLPAWEWRAQQRRYGGEYDGFKGRERAATGVTSQAADEVQCRRHPAHLLTFLTACRQRATLASTPAPASAPL